jgi:hypothetical protein
MECVIDTFDEDQIMKEIEKQMQSIDKNSEVHSLTHEEKEKLKEAVHDKQMLTDTDGQVHHIEEIDYIIKDILKHQNKAFKYERDMEQIEELIECEDGTENTFLRDRDFAPSENASLDYTNEQVIKDQRGVTMYLIKKIGVNLLSGKSIMNISLPIKLFEPHSMLEKVASSFTFSPYYLLKAKEQSNPLERIKILLTGYIASLQLEPQMLKPFNPILGETFQAIIGEYEIVLEQISHHPPITGFQLW